ncbi:ATP-dependent DNA helicase RRM3 [Yarrowia sp. C11]|nr:ATP-dependent DNA helicase RRM3 [Yarrowia sp. E02]KAG5369247.1 ATP-dependent DNA helicase RRM3 [Yarrowia sp. C11]
MARINKIAKTHYEQPDRYQRQRLEEGNAQINALMDQLRERETSEGIPAGRTDTEEDCMEVDEPCKEEPEDVEIALEEAMMRGKAQVQEARTGQDNNNHKMAHVKARPKHAQQDDMFSGDWWKEWSPEELATVVAYYKQDLRQAMQSHSGLDTNEMSALHVTEMKRLMRRDSKKLLLAQLTSSLNQRVKSESPVKREDYVKREDCGNISMESRDSDIEFVQTVAKEEDFGPDSSQNTNLHTGMPRSSQQQHADGEPDVAAANTTTLSLLEPQNVVLTPEQETICNLVKSGKSVFFTGGAGTGKSVLIKEIKNYCESAGITCKVTAPTGLAAVNVNGITLYRWAGLGLMKEDAEMQIAKLMKNPRSAAVWKYTDVLIIDECSMVSGALFDKIETIARRVRADFKKVADYARDQHMKDQVKKVKTPGKKVQTFEYLSRMLKYSDADAVRDSELINLPFGGMQVVCVGDFFQLPPVPSFEEKNAYVASRIGGSNAGQPPPDFLFNSEAFNKTFKSLRLRLTVAKRQTAGSEFAKMLELFRKYRGTTDEAVTLRNYFSQFIGRHPAGLQCSHLQSTIDGVLNTNQKELQQLDGPEVFFFAADIRNTNDYNADFVERAMKDIPAEQKLCLKPGAQIMYLKNNYEKGLVNGHMGQVAFLMTPEMYEMYKDDLEFLFLIQNSIGTRNIRSLSKNPETPKEIIEYLPGMKHHQWAYYRYALMHIDEEYRQQALAQKKKNRELEEQGKPARHNTELLVIFRLADEYMVNENDEQFFMVATDTFEKLDYSRLLTKEQREKQMIDAKYPTICSRVQLPITLSWALTIHKAQGQTLIRTVVDMKGMFAEGQAYVAMSRVRNPEDLKLTCFEVPKVTCPEVTKFDATIRDALSAKEPDSNEQKDEKPKGLLDFFKPKSHKRSSTHAS